MNKQAVIFEVTNKRGITKVQVNLFRNGRYELGTQFPKNVTLQTMQRQIHNLLGNDAKITDTRK